MRESAGNAAVVENRVLNVPDGIEVINTNGKGKGIRATKAWSKGSRIFRFVGNVGCDSETTNYALQIGEDEYLESTEEFDNYLNHSCEPNCFIDSTTMELTTLREIEVGEELSFDYNITEYDLVVHDCDFDCQCGTSSCLGRVEGFRYLSPAEREARREHLFPHLRAKLSSC